MLLMVMAFAVSRFSQALPYLLPWAGFNSEFRVSIVHFVPGPSSPGKNEAHWHPVGKQLLDSIDSRPVMWYQKIHQV